MIDSIRYLDAAGKGDAETVRQYLNQADAEIECRGYLNMTALLMAASEGHAGVVRILLERGADIHNAWYPDNNNGTALEMAAERGHAEIVDLLLAAGSKANNPSTGKSFALIEAARAGHLSIADRLLDAGANGNSATADDTTVLILISGFGPNHVLNPDVDRIKGCMNKLLDGGADVNAVDNLSSTALTRAVNAANEPVVQFLLDAGADPNLAAAQMPVGQLVRYTGCLNRMVEAGLDSMIFEGAISAALLGGQVGSAASLADALPDKIGGLHKEGISFVKGCATD